jgi:tetrachlorobenzoquinone reductase
VRLQSIEYGARNINLYKFVAVDGRPLDPVAPGAHIDLEINGEHRRSYSLTNSSDAPDEYIIGVHANPKGRGGSVAWHRESVVGDTYSISNPRNNFPLSESRDAAYLFAGGIGITPIVSMYRYLKANGTPAKLFYWVRSTEDILFRSELAPDGSVEIFVTGEAGECGPRIGECIRSVPLNAELYCCGPSGMLSEYQAATASRPGNRVHFEKFSGEPIEANQGSFTVRLAKLGKTIEVQPGQSILQACLDAGVEMSYSCEEGICGACETHVLQGAVIHRDSFRTPEEHDKLGTMMVCCSVAAGDELVLDI